MSGIILRQILKIITYKPFNNHLVNSMDYQDLCLIAFKK